MTAITPQAASAGSIQINGVTIGGTSNVKFGDKNKMVDITSLGDLAKMQFPTNQEWSLSFDFYYSTSDSGQAAIFASKSAKTNVPYRVYLTGTKYYACAGGYVESVETTLEDPEVVKISVTIASHDTATFT